MRWNDWMRGFYGKLQCFFNRHVLVRETVVAIARNKRTTRRRLIQQEVIVCSRCGVIVEGGSEDLLPGLRARR